MTSEVVLEGLRASIRAAYTIAEARALLDDTQLLAFEVSETLLGLRMTGAKPG
jgi:hypothetical protein